MGGARGGMVCVKSKGGVDDPGRLLDGRALGYESVEQNPELSAAPPAVIDAEHYAHVAVGLLAGEVLPGVGAVQVGTEWAGLVAGSGRGPIRSASTQLSFTCLTRVRDRDQAFR